MTKLFTFLSFVKQFSPFISKMKAFSVHILSSIHVFNLRTHSIVIVQKAICCVLLSIISSIVRIAFVVVVVEFGLRFKCVCFYRTIQQRLREHLMKFYLICRLRRDSRIFVQNSNFIEKLP